MPFANYIYEYFSGIQSGKYTVGKWVRLIYEIIIAGLERGEYFFNAKKANKAIKFIENFCHHCEGREDLLKLEVWQKACVSVIFGIVDADGLRVFREVFIVIGRKNGKTLFASAIIAYMAYLDGEYGAKIYCLAPKLDQAAIVYDNFYQMLKKEPELAELAKKRRSDIYIEDTNTVVKPLAFNAKKSDGFNPHLVVNDEVASWRGDGGLKQYEVMKSALGARRQPLILSISTAGYENDGIYDELMKRSTAFLKGNSKERRLLPFLYMIDDVEKWNDIEELKKANPNMGVSVFPDFFREEIAVAEMSASKKAEFLTKYCNIKQNSSIAWLDAHIVEGATAEITLEDFRHSYAVGGIDLSQTTDLTAATVIVERGGKLYAFTQFFMPANRVERATAIDGVPYDIFVKKGVVTLSGENYVDYKAILYADDGADEVVKEFVSGELTLNVNDLLPADLAAILGQTQDDDQVVYAGENDDPPYMAIGFRAKKANGMYKYIWLYKVKFAIPSENYQTKGDSIEFTTPEITGQFIKRPDGLWKAEHVALPSESAAQSWFTEVREPNNASSGG